MTDIPPSGTAFITGAAKRIGKAIALQLAQQGHNIALHYNGSKEAADETVAEILALGVKAISLQADLAHSDECRGLIASAAEALGPVTVLINNASRFEMDTLADFDDSSWDAHLNANLRAPAILSQEFAAALPEDKKGNIINLLDQRVWNLTPYFLSYTLSKTGLWTLTQTLAMGLAPQIRVNAIGPGPTVPSPRQSAAHFKAQSESVPLRQGSNPQEIASAVSFILQTNAMTGQMIALDGGQHLPWRSNKTLDIE